MGAVITEVDVGSVAEAAGLSAGDVVESVNGQPLRDILDWQWLSADEVCTLSVMRDGVQFTVNLQRTYDQPWGIAFEGALFDDVRLCKNACTFCFMHQLPQGLRKPLYVRDDDFRLSFLQGNFVTLTNLTADDVQRIVEQRISPLRVSLHAAAPDVREHLMGRNAALGIDNLCALLQAGIAIDAQIVLVPGVNDGAVLEDTLTWCYQRPGITNVGVVPLGYTRYQSRFSAGFDEPHEAAAVLKQLHVWQRRAQHERGYAWVYAADEFYLDAFGTEALSHIPPASFYEDFSMFEDGIGIVRSCVSEFQEASASGLLDEVAQALQKASVRVVFIYGEAMRAYVPQLFQASPLATCVEALFVPNHFFGGNVNVTGLLAGADMTLAISEHAAFSASSAHGAKSAQRTWYALPAIAFNADDLTVDDLTLTRVYQESGQHVIVAPSNPLHCFQYILELIKEM